MNMAPTKFEIAALRRTSNVSEGAVRKNGSKLVSNSFCTFLSTTFDGVYPFGSY